MAVTSFANGTQSATVATEHSLASVNASGTYRLWVDRVNMVAGDALELRVKGKVLAGGTKRVIDVYAFTGAPPTDDTIVITDAYETELAVTDGLEFTLKQTFGTSRNFDWNVRKIA